jgi:hypothetical protein
MVVEAVLHGDGDLVCLAELNPHHRMLHVSEIQGLERDGGA